MRGPLILGPLLVSACYSEGDPDSEPTSNGGTSSTQTERDPSTSGSESGTTDAAGCGDGDVGPDEDCDDGNDTPGDGCSSCRGSGTLLLLETDGVWPPAFGVTDLAGAGATVTGFETVSTIVGAPWGGSECAA